LSTSTEQITLPADELVRCPKCHEYIHAYELEAVPYEEYPRVLYKEAGVTTPRRVPPSYETTIVSTEEEHKKALEEGWIEEVPQPGVDPEPKAASKESGKSAPAHPPAHPPPPDTHAKK
jgi:hypothetical protein